jgi:sugar-phosphatase
MTAAELRMPEIRITAESVSASKPDPEGFLKGAAELGVDPADCIVFEDSGAGIAAGHAAGMRVLGIGPRAAEHAPTAHVADLTSVSVTTTESGEIRLTLTAHQAV